MVHSNLSYWPFVIQVRRDKHNDIITLIPLFDFDDGFAHVDL